MYSFISCVDNTKTDIPCWFSGFLSRIMLPLPTVAEGYTSSLLLVQLCYQCFGDYFSNKMLAPNPLFCDYLPGDKNSNENDRYIE